MALLTAPQVRREFGGITEMTLWRWLRDDRLGFPKPIVIGRRRYFRAAEIEAFLEQKAAQSGAVHAA